MIWDEFPAVTIPPGRKEALRVASTSTEVSGRMPSSAVTIPAAWTGAPLSTSHRHAGVGTISPAKRPSAVARAARACDSAE